MLDYTTELTEITEKTRFLMPYYICIIFHHAIWIY